jgi:hypothetical protein
MLINIISWSAVAAILAVSIGLLITHDWRWSLGLLAGQHLAAFWLVTLHWPVGLASVKLVSGWMGIAALGMTRLSITEEEEPEPFWPRRQWFHMFLAGIIALLTAAASPRLEEILPGIGLPVVAGSVLLIGMGLIHLGITSQILRVILGLFTVLNGFEIMYAAVEGSILVAGLLAVVHLGLALVGSYLLLTISEETPA